jgi:hypothetical protein
MKNVIRPEQAEQNTLEWYFEALIRSPLDRLLVKPVLVIIAAKAGV